MTLSRLWTSMSTYFSSDEEYDRVGLGIVKPGPGSFWIKWRASDILMILIVFVVYFYLNTLEPFQRQFYINDLTISHPFAEVERVNESQLFWYAYGFPFLIIAVIGLLITKPRDKIYLTYTSLLGLSLSVFTTSTLTNILKNFIGRHRPDFLARCIPREGTPVNVLVFAKDVCTSENSRRLLDGFRTTPSGHSSMSFSGLFYLSLWLAGQTVATHQYTGSLRIIFSALPTLGATLVALSRTEDYRHHFVDVLIGSTIGLVIGYWSYFRLFPSLREPLSYKTLITIEEESSQTTSNNAYQMIEESV